jgi:hypothetical protein
MAAIPPTNIDSGHHFPLPPCCAFLSLAPGPGGPFGIDWHLLQKGCRTVGLHYENLHDNRSSYFVTIL